MTVLVRNFRRFRREHGAICNACREPSEVTLDVLTRGGAAPGGLGALKVGGLAVQARVCVKRRSRRVCEIIFSARGDASVSYLCQAVAARV